MLPPFDRFGNLPPGIHGCTVAELAERFGAGSPERMVQTEELLELVEWARRAAVARMIVNGSYVTAKVAPNDVDVIILPSANYPQGERPLDDRSATWPFLQVLIAADDADLERWALEDFGTDRLRRTKGVVEVTLQ